MKRFIIKAVCFAVLIAIVLMIAVCFVPSPEMRGSLLSMGPIKNELLRKTRPPRIILVGGSNLSHGLNSQVISDTFGFPVINMGLHGGLGLRFMLEEVRPVVQKEDFVVVVPEYSLYETSGFWGNIELLGMVFDVMPEMRKRLSPLQWACLVKYVPNYGTRKIVNTVGNLFQCGNATVDIRQAYNSFGDCIGHWSQKPLSVPPVPQVKHVRLSWRCFNYLETFVSEMRVKGARVAIMPPCFQASSYDHSLPLIERIEEELRKRDMPLLAPMRRYRIADHFCGASGFSV